MFYFRFCIVFVFVCLRGNLIDIRHSLIYFLLRSQLKSNQSIDQDRVLKEAHFCGRVVVRVFTVVKYNGLLRTRMGRLILHPRLPVSNKPKGCNPLVGIVGKGVERHLGVSVCIRIYKRYQFFSIPTVLNKLFVRIGQICYFCIITTSIQ